MKKIGILAVIAVAIVAFGYFMVFSTSTETAKNTSNNVNNYANEDEIAALESQDKIGMGTLNELRLLGDDLECNISYVPEEGETGVVEGTYFVHEGNMRGDFLTDSPDLSGQTLTSMIIKDGTMYIWSEIEGETYGMQMNIESESELDIDTNGPINIDDQIDYRCVSWANVDRTVFVPPSEVLFQDMSELMRAGMEYGVE